MFNTSLMPNPRETERIVMSASNTAVPSVTAENANVAAKSMSLNVEKSQYASMRTHLSKWSSADEQESISPLMLSKTKDVDDFNLDSNGCVENQGPSCAKVSSNSLTRTPSGSAPYHSRRAKTMALGKQASSSDYGASSLEQPFADDPEQGHVISAVLEEVVAWLHAEKAKKLAREREMNAKSVKQVAPHSSSIMASRRASDASDDGSPDLEKLESILEKRLQISHPPRTFHKGGSRRRRQHKSSPPQDSRHSSAYKSSDTDNYDEDHVVPSCDVFLDDSQTALDNRSSGPTVNPSESSSSLISDYSALHAEEAWVTFKYEICRLAKTLRIKGWRHFSLSGSKEIAVERLSGALTNAVYVVSAPYQESHGQRSESIKLLTSTKRRPPQKLILRIYGPRVEHLIDRETELRVLRRLARKNIGPRLLGTFRNGRFEEFFYAKPLEPRDLRVPETYQKIAKRMRELHNGIELLEEERLGGPVIWRNWDRWVERAEHLVARADVEIQKITAAKSSNIQQYVCGTPWKIFRRTVEEYREQLNIEYGSPSKVNEQLVFAHNDTQYGNILRLEPPGESPLLLPANQHKQLVVIDFEYANANLPGLEFANHFTEWCYNYHDSLDPFRCNTAKYPTIDEQYHFIRTYVLHRPKVREASSPVPRYTPLPLKRSALLDPGPRYENLKVTGSEEPESVEPALQGCDTDLHREIQRLMHETRLWRIANSAQWVLWGILQADLPDDLTNDGIRHRTGAQSEIKTVSGQPPEQAAAQVEVEAGINEEFQTCPKTPEPGGFDYLSYARDRAMFFWGDCLQLGLTTEKVLGEDLMKEVKIVTY